MSPGDGVPAYGVLVREGPEAIDTGVNGVAYERAIVSAARRGTFVLAESPGSIIAVDFSRLLPLYSPPGECGPRLR